VSATLFFTFFSSYYITYMLTLKFLLHLYSHWKNIMRLPLHTTLLRTRNWQEDTYLEQARKCCQSILDEPKTQAAGTTCEIKNRHITC